MSTRFRPVLALWGLIAGLTGLVGTAPVKADAPWADNHYGYRRPLTITTNVGAGMAAGDIIAYSFNAAAPEFLNKLRSDSQDVKIFFSADGTTHTDIPQMLLPMGASGRVLFPLQAAVPAKPYGITETIAGKTAYDSLPKGPALTFTSLNSGTVTVTLPFPVTLRDRTSSQITIAIDGYIGLGATDPGRPTTTDTGAGKYIIMPFQSNFSTRGGEGQGVFFTADSSEAVIKWELQASSSVVEPITAKFACVIKADGTIRFVYGDPCQMPAGYDTVGGPEGTDPVRYGVGVGDSTKSVITQPAWDAFEGVNFGTPAHDDITYTQADTTQAIPGYWVYYGYPEDTGARTAPTGGLQGCDFSDGQLHGWKSMNMLGQEGTATADVRINNDPTFGNELRFQGGDAPLYYLPFMYWGDMSPKANAISYVKLRANGQHGILHRLNLRDPPLVSSTDFSTYPSATDIPALGTSWCNWDNALAVTSSVQDTEEMWDGVGRRHTGPSSFGPSQPYVQPNTDLYQYNITATTDTADGHTVVGAKQWPSQAILTEPSNWYITGTAPGTAPLPAGQLAMYNYRATVFVKWAYVVDNPYAESMQYTPGAEATIIVPPGVLQGTVTELYSHKPEVGANVTLVDATGNYIKSMLTDAQGRYSFGIPNGGTVSVGVTVGSAGRGAHSAAPINVASGNTVTADFITSVLVNGDMEIPNAANTKPDAWDWHTRWPTAVTTDLYAYTREQNHTPGGFWSIKMQNPAPQSAGNPDNVEPTAGSGTDLGGIPSDITLSAWVRSDTEGLGVRIRTFTAGWEGAGANGDGTANGGGQWKQFKASPNLAAGELPLNTWVQITTTNHYAVNPAKGVNVCFYGGDFQSRPVSGNIYIDDVAITVTPKYMACVQVVDDAGQPIPSPWLGGMTYGTLFTPAAQGAPSGRAYYYFGTNAPVTVAAWKAPTNRGPGGLDATGALVGVKTITPVAYDPNPAPTATITVSGQAVNVLGGTNTTTGLVDTTGTPASQWPAYLIDKRIDKTTSNPDSGDSTDPSTWVQVQRNAGPVLAGRVWDANVSGEGNGWGSGGLRQVFSPGADPAPGIPERYRSSTLDIDMGATQSIDQLEFGYFYVVKKHRVWISDTPFQWNVELPDSQAIVNTTTDTVSVATLGFTAANKPYDSTAMGGYQIYRLPTPARGRYLRVRQDGAPYDDGHQIMLEMRAMHSTAISTGDVTEILRIAAGLQAGPLNTESRFTLLDANANGTIDILDAVKLSRTIAH